MIRSERMQLINNTLIGYNEERNAFHVYSPALPLEEFLESLTIYRMIQVKQSLYYNFSEWIKIQ